MKPAFYAYRLPKALFVTYLIALTGCAHYDQLHDARHGDSVRSAIAVQTIGPSETRLLPYPGGQDGEAAREAFRSYLRSLHQKGPAAEPLSVDRR
jgi:hypothetical protein